MGGECIDLMNECIFVGVLVANVQSGARSYFCGSNLQTKGFGSEGLAARMAAQLKERRGCVFIFFFLPPHVYLRGIQISLCCIPVH